MTVRQFSDEFDVLLNSFSHGEAMGDSPQDIVLDEYEKSVYLTKAQKEVVLSYYTGKSATGESFEQTEEVRRYLSNLVREVSLSPMASESGLPLGVSDSSKFFTLPEDLWFITYEAVKVGSDDCHDGSMIDVIPVTQDEYHRIKRNPFRGASGRRALRLDLSGGVVEVVSKYTVSGYYVRYMARLSPIILVSLPDGLEIDGENSPMTCGLHEALHAPILERAVLLAVSGRQTAASSERPTIYK